MYDWSKKLGTPDIKIAGLQILIHNRPFPESKDYWDANWLNVTVHCGAQDSSIRVIVATKGCL